MSNRLLENNMSFSLTARDRDSKALKKGFFPLYFSFCRKCYMQMVFLIYIFVMYQLSLYGTKFNLNKTVGSQIVAHTLVETGNGPNRPNTIDL